MTAVVLTYNGRELLEVALPSLAAQRHRDVRTVVVDNGSDDGTLAWLAEHWPDVRVVALPENVGVTAALNVCLDAADTDLVGLFNNDVELHPDCIGELVRALDEHPDAGSACAKLVDYYDRTRLDGTGDVFLWTGEAHRRGQGEADLGQYDEPEEVFGACGGAALYRRTALERVGPFDERLHAIKEDVDWAFRAQLAGFSCRYVPSAVAYHMGGATLGAELGDFALYQNWRNNIWLIAKNYPASAFLRHGHQLLWGQVKNLLFALRGRRVRVWLRVLRDALRGMPATLRDRRAVQRRRVLSTRELERLVGVLR